MTTTAPTQFDVLIQEMQQLTAALAGINIGGGGANPPPKIAI